MNDFECGEYVFSSNFDSGNLRKVELVRTCTEEESSEYSIHAEFNLWTSPDCYGTQFENLNRTWFFFSIKGGQPFNNVKLNIKNLNRQAKLFSQGMQPVVRIGENGKWERIKDRPAYATEADCFYISFFHRTSECTNIPVYYAFTYPFTYTENLNLLNKLDKKYGRSQQTVEYIANRLACLDKEEKDANKKTDQIKQISSIKGAAKDPVRVESSGDDLSIIPSSPSDSIGGNSSPSSCESLYDKMTKRELQNEIYYHRELLINSLQNRRVELLTITSYHGIQPESEERLSNLFPDLNISRCRNFKDKKIIFMSSRVHPGETAASFVLNGFMSLLLDRKSLIGQMLRQMYVFKIVPFLNPDGVYNGLYRTDTLGQNLNRMYICPQIDRQPSIYAVKKLIKFYHLGYDRFDEDNRKCELIESHVPNSPVKALSPKCVLEKRDEINSTASLFDFVEKMRSESSKKECEIATRIYSSKETTSSEGEENNSPTVVQNPNTNTHPQGKVFTDKLIPELKTVAQEPLPKKLSGSSGFGKKSSDHLGRKNLAFKTVFGTNHGTISRSNENKLKDLQTTTSVQRPKFKKIISRKEVKTGNSSSVTLKAMNKRNLLCCQNIDISVEHGTKIEDGIEKTESSNLFLYMDFHGHASKKGIFMYGNHFQNTPEAVECMLLPRLMGINCQHFHYDACNFSERNMYRREKRDGLSKEGSGRVAVFKMTGLIKSYTLESNYNTGKYVNSLPTRTKDANQKPSNIVPPKYTPSIYEEVGRALGPSILDITNSNSLSRIYNSEYRSIQALRIALRNEVERHVTQRSGVAGGKVNSSHQAVKRVKRSSLATVATPNDVPKENKIIYHSNLSPWDMAVPSSSTQSSTISILHGLNQPAKVAQRTTRCIKRNPLKAHSTNLYGKKDSIVVKKKPKAVLLIESACGSSKKDNFQIPLKKVRVSPTHNFLVNESSPSARKQVVEASTTPEPTYKAVAVDNQKDLESSCLVEGLLVPLTVDMTSKTLPASDGSSQPLPKQDKPSSQLLNSLTQFYPRGDASLMKKCSSESVLDLYTTKAETTPVATSSNNVSSCKTTGGALDEVVASCSHRLIVHASNKKPMLATFRKTKKAESFILKSVTSSNSMTTHKPNLNPKIKSAFGSGEGAKLVKKKRIIRHDSLIVKRKKNKAKITRH